MATRGFGPGPKGDKFLLVGDAGLGGEINLLPGGRRGDSPELGKSWIRLALTEASPARGRKSIRWPEMLFFDHPAKISVPLVVNPGRGGELRPPRLHGQDNSHWLEPVGWMMVKKLPATVSVALLDERLVLADTE